jgi:hypothetical protein
MANAWTFAALWVGLALMATLVALRAAVTEQA